MKFALPLKLATLATAAVSSLLPLSSSNAVTFGEQEVNQRSFVAVAQPFGSSSYNLLVLEQIPGKNQCWSESGSNPTLIDPLLLNFNFSGHCRRSTDSNGYSIRVDGADQGLDYFFNIVERNGELVLVGTPRDRSDSEIVIGRTGGVGNGFHKINLDSGWRFTKRTYDGRTLGHVYLSSGDPPAFLDIAGDIYKNEIEDSVELGFIAGFPEDNTFRPTVALTREQIVSMVIEALSTIPGANVTVPSQATSQPFPDVASNRWSAAKIQWAQQNDIVSGYPDGTFRPSNTLTRAELMAVLKKAAVFANTQRGLAAELTAKNSQTNFSDTTSHWAENLIDEMSSYCEVASPVNEVGSSFSPNSQSQRNYAAAATLRMLNCVKDEN